MERETMIYYNSKQIADQSEKEENYERVAL